MSIVLLYKYCGHIFLSKPFYQNVLHLVRVIHYF